MLNVNITLFRVTLYIIYRVSCAFSEVSPFHENKKDYSDKPSVGKVTLFWTLYSKQKQTFRPFPSIVNCKNFHQSNKSTLQRY